MQPILELQHVGKTYTLETGEKVEALHDVDFGIHEREFVSIIGPSGCGKTTLLKILGGFIKPTTGALLEHMPDVLAKRGMMFQQYNLFPWLSVQANIEFGLSMMNVPSRNRQKIAAHYIDVMGLHGFEQAYPKELSGGMQQRVALGRTFATNPQLLLMDEPFSSLDVQTKRFMQDLLLQAWSKEPRTIVFITHDVEEAVFMSDTVYIMSPRPGTIREKVSIQLPRPRTLETEFSSDFVKVKRYIQETITKESLGLMKLDLDIYKSLK
jgi:ABC-type nitrate/sulfonate/bicarbonate transport system ATPase subunit